MLGRQLHATAHPVILKKINHGRKTPPDAELSTDRRRGGVVYLIYAIVTTLILIADRLTKMLVMSKMVEGESIPLLPPVLYFTYVHNKGAAFGFLKGQVIFLSLVSLAFIVVIATQWKKIKAKSFFTRWGIVISFAGAIGNLIDRILYRSVVDFIDIRIFIFNIADVAIVLGAALLFWEVVIHDRKTR